MSKFHINKHGVPAPCKATKGNCPYGGESGTENHFDTEEEAGEHASQVLEQEHGFLPNLKSDTYVPEERRVNLYHATSSQVLQKIIEDGSLSPPSDSGLTSNGLGFDKSAEADGVYLASSHQNVSIYVDGSVDNGVFNKNLSNCGAIIELYADSDNLIADKDDYKGENVDSATWQDSLEDCNQVVHKGSIQAGQIKSVTFTAPFNMGGFYNSEKRSVKEMIEIRNKVLNGKKLSIKEASELLKGIDKEMTEKFS